jgi:digeranylgeranylglycerophospholipid reductase
MTEKIAIIGGGPAGLTAAIAGVNQGMDVTLFESRGIGENINCAEGFFDILKMLQPPEQGVHFKVESVFVQTEELHKINVKNLNLWMIDRRRWQLHMAEKARLNGARIFIHKRIKAEDLPDLKQKYDWVLDASGVPAVSSVYYGFKDIYYQEALITVQYRVRGDFSFLAKGIKVVLFNEPPGYGWIFPKGDEIANIGLGVFNLKAAQTLKGQELYRRLDLFLLNQGIKGEIINRAAGICPNRIPHKLVHGNLLLLGDAAGLTSPLHGGGLDMACISARLAIDLIKDGNGYQYQNRLYQAIGEKIRLEQQLKDLWLNQEVFLQKLINLLDSEIGDCERVYKMLLNWRFIFQKWALMKEIWKIFEGG